MLQPVLCFQDWPIYVVSAINLPTINGSLSLDFPTENDYTCTSHESKYAFFKFQVVSIRYFVTVGRKLTKRI